MASMIRGSSTLVCSALLMSLGSGPSVAMAEEAGPLGELLLLQQISRHGSRSPKSNYVTECPLDPYLYQWDSWNAQLTAPGDLEEAAVGKVTRRMYGAWIGLYNGSQMTVRATDSDRVLQSAEIAMSILFPEGTGMQQGLPGRPTFVPVHTVPEEDDNLLAAPAEACWARHDADAKSWWKANGAGIFQAGEAAKVPLTEYCGVAASKGKVLKDVIDGIGFAIQQGFPVNLTSTEVFAAQNLSIVLQRGDFATDEAQTYMAMDLPATLVANMKQAIALEGSDQSQRYLGYFSHRHALYALAEFLGWSWNQHGIPEGMITTATTVWIELRRGAMAGQYDVALLQWAPHCGARSMSACPAEPISLPGCARRNGTLCSIEEFGAIVSQRIARTGNWQTLCGAELVV